MNAGDRLVAVSTYDHPRPPIERLPRVGDYQTVDWEQIAAAHPAVMIVQIAADRLPAGFNQRAQALHIQLMDLSINRLADVPAALVLLGDTLHLQQQAKTAERQMAQRLAAVQAAAGAGPAVPTLIVVGGGGTDLAGPGTFLDDLLQVAGGANVAAPLGKPWPSVDAEMLGSLRPAVIVQLMPDASPQERAAAMAGWSRFSQIPAVAAGRVYIIDDWYAQLPGWHVTDLAEKFAKLLHQPQQQ